MTNASRQPDQEPRKNQQLLVVGVCLAAAGAVGIGWWGYQRQNRPEKGVTRSTSDFVVEWRCLGCDHAITANAGPGPKTCPKCNKPKLYVSLHWTCPAHGTQAIAFQYDTEGQPTQVKLGKGDWAPAFDADGGWNIRCPTCKGAMMPSG